MRTSCCKFGEAEGDGWREQVTPLMAAEAGNDRLKVTEKRQMKEMEEMKGKEERYLGRPGGDQ